MHSSTRTTTMCSRSKRACSSTMASHSSTVTRTSISLQPMATTCSVPRIQARRQGATQAVLVGEGLDLAGGTLVVLVAPAGVVQATCHQQTEGEQAGAKGLQAGGMLVVHRTRAPGVPGEVQIVA